MPRRPSHLLVQGSRRAIALAPSCTLLARCLIGPEAHLLLEQILAFPLGGPPRDPHLVAGHLIVVVVGGEVSAAEVAGEAGMRFLFFARINAPLCVWYIFAPLLLGGGALLPYSPTYRPVPAYKNLAEAGFLMRGLKSIAIVVCW